MTTTEVKLTICRGVARTGKTTYAKTLQCLLVEADMYFVRNGNYEFNVDEHQYAKTWRNRVASETIASRADCCVTGQFITLAEVTDLILECLHKVRGRFDFSVEIIDFATRYPTQHGVPEEKVLSNIEKFEPATAERLEKLLPNLDVTARAIGPSASTYINGYVMMLAEMGHDVAVTHDGKILIGEHVSAKIIRLLSDYVNLVDESSRTLNLREIVNDEDKFECFVDSLYDLLWDSFESTEIANTITDAVNASSDMTLTTLFSEIEALRQSVNTQ